MSRIKSGILYILPIIVLLFVLGSCNKKTYNDDSIILIGTEDYVAHLENIIPDSIDSDFRAFLGDTPEGYIPPNVEGEYLISNKVFCGSNFFDIFDDCDMHLRISGQHNRMATVEFHESSIVVTDTAFVMGIDNSFTLYFMEKREIHFYGNEFWVDRCVVITGKKQEWGIEDLMFGSIIMKAYKGDNPFIGTFIPGRFFVYKDADGRSVNCKWFDYQ